MGTRKAAPRALTEDEAEAIASYRISADGRTLIIRRRESSGVLITTLERHPDAGPFTDATAQLALALLPDPGTMERGQRTRLRRRELPFGILRTYLSLGPPTWWLPRLPWKRDGALMMGWLRVCVAIDFQRRGSRAPSKGAG